MKIIISLLSFLIFSLLVLVYVKITKPPINNWSYKEKEINFTNIKPEGILELSKFKYNILPARILYEKIDFRKRG